MNIDNFLMYFLLKKYELNQWDIEKITERIIEDLENNYLEWNKISCKWEIK